MEFLEPFDYEILRMESEKAEFVHRMTISQLIVWATTILFRDEALRVVIGDAFKEETDV